VGYPKIITEWQVVVTFSFKNVTKLTTRGSFIACLYLVLALEIHLSKGRRFGSD
jgi:hypothetical protein